MNKQPTKIDFAVGGQAVIEGVMMRSPNYLTVSVRKNHGGIKGKDEAYRAFCQRVKFFGLPVVRGVANLFEMMIVGVRILNYSAQEQLDEPEVKSKKDGMIEKAILAGSFAFSIVFALGLSLFLFKFLPLWITELLSKNFDVFNRYYFLYNLVDGILKTVFFIMYIGLMGLLPSLKRVFEYHGAEHKSIYTYENGLDLTVENAKKQSRFHPRCGTSFILVVFLISILVYTVLPRQEDFMANFGLRVLFLPLIAGISYEFLKWSAKTKDNFLVRLMITPGLWFQRLTTREPDDFQLEVALDALKKALELEEQHAAKTALAAVTVKA
jgi:uncharacterized protein YqhQ